MRPVSDLGKLYDSFVGRLLRIRRLFGLVRIATEPRRSELAAVSAIELDNLVLSTSRSLMISSLRKARTARGIRINTSIPLGHEEEIAAYMLSVLDINRYRKLKSPSRIKKREEPNLRDPRSIEKVFISCSASNLISLQNALALRSPIFIDLGTVRNFYAHRNADTWQKVKTKAQSQGVFGIDHPNQFLEASLPGRPVTIFEDWMDDAELFFYEATK